MTMIVRYDRYDLMMTEWHCSVHALFCLVSLCFVLRKSQSINYAFAFCRSCPFPTKSLANWKYEMNQETKQLKEERSSDVALLFLLHVLYSVFIRMSTNIDDANDNSLQIIGCKLLPNNIEKNTVE